VPVLAEAGARFVVSPNTDPRVIGAALDAGLDPIPGALTATEVASAIGAGAALVKLFPAGPLGTAYLRALRGPFGDVDFVPTGGIAHDAVGEWLAAGAVAVGLGSDLVPARPTDADLAGIQARARVATT
jgi:Entner-Doudoroff aldolase